MKRIYLLMILMIAMTTSSFARTVDLRLLHYFAMDPSTTLSLMKDGDKIISSAGGEASYNFGWNIKNISATDSVKAVDTLFVHAYYQGTSYFKLVMGANGFPAYLKPGDSISFTPSSGKVTLSPTSSVTTSGTSNVQWCDTLWVKPCASCGNTVTETALANNKTCNTIALTSWVTSVGIVQAGVQGLVLYPNPATNKASIAYDFGNNNSGIVTVTDVTGKAVYTKNLGNNISGTQKFDLELSHLNSGVYFLQLKTNDKTESMKFIMQ